MARPVKPRSATQHLITLSRLSRSIEVDPTLTPRRRARLLSLAAKLMAELQKALTQ